MKQSVWQQAFEQARKETLELIRLDNPWRGSVTIFAPLLGVFGIWAITGELVVSALWVLSAVMIIGILVFCLKLTLAPAKIAEAALVSSNIDSQQKGALESRKRRDLITRLTQLYKLEMGAMTPDAVKAGLQLPPAGWLNEQLAEQGVRWQIADTQGMDFQTFELKVIRWEFNGLRLKSQSAVKWAVFFDSIGIHMEANGPNAAGTFDFFSAVSKKAIFE